MLAKDSGAQGVHISFSYKEMVKSYVCIDNVINIPMLNN